MKKKLLALAVAGALAAPVAAMADTTIYGQANVSYDSVTSGLPAGSATTNHVSSNASRIGFKGSEDLGGISAIWQIESLVNIDNSTGSAAAPAAGTANGFGTRNTFAGLSGESLGTLLLGRHDTPYKLATRGLDMFAETIADNRSIMGLAGAHDARLTDVAAYISPAMGGLTVAVATVAGAEAYTAGATKGAAWSLAGMYNAGPVNASLSYQKITAGTNNSGTMGVGNGVVPGTLAANDTLNAWKIGGGYTMDALAVNAIYEKTGSSGSIGNGADRAAWYLAGKYNVSASDAVKLAYTSAGKVNSVVSTEGTQYAVGYDHNMSKRTTVYALYTKLSNKAVAAYNLGGSGIATSGAAITADADPSAFSVGMKHTF